MAKIERSFEVCPIFEFYVYYAEFMVISVSLGSCGGHFHPTALKRLSWEFCTKNFWSHTAGGAFDNQVFFIRGTCLQLGTLSPGISYRSGGTPSWAKSSFESQQLDWCNNEMRELLWELPVGFRNTTCWWVTDEDVAGISLNARGGGLWFANVMLVAFLFSSKHTIMSLTFVVVKSRLWPWLWRQSSDGLLDGSHKKWHF